MVCSSNIDGFLYNLLYFVPLATFVLVDTPENCRKRQAAQWSVSSSLIRLANVKPSHPIMICTSIMSKPLTLKSCRVNSMSSILHRKDQRQNNPPTTFYRPSPSTCQRTMRSSRSSRLLRDTVPSPSLNVRVLFQWHHDP